MLTLVVTLLPDHGRILDLSRAREAVPGPRRLFSLISMGPEIHSALFSAGPHLASWPGEGPTQRRMARLWGRDR